MGKIADLIPVKHGEYLPVRCSDCGKVVVYEGEGSFSWGIATSRKLVVAHNGCHINFGSQNNLDLTIGKRNNYNPIPRRRRKGTAPTVPADIPDMPVIPEHLFPEPEPIRKSFTAPRGN